MQVVDAAHGLAVQAEDQVAFLQPRAIGGPVRIDADDQHTAAPFDLLSLPRSSSPGGKGTVLDGDADPARRTRPSRIKRPATNLAVLIAMAKQIPCAGRIIAVLTPMTLPRESTSGPPELPGFKAASVCSTSSISRPDPARSDLPRRPPLPPSPSSGSRRDDRSPGQSAHAQPSRSHRRGRHKFAGMNADHSQVGLGIVADLGSLVRAAVGQRDLKVLRAMDDVAVGQDVAARREDKPRAASPRLPAAPGLAEARLDMNNRWPHAFRRTHNGPGIGVQEFRVIVIDRVRGAGDRGCSPFGIAQTFRPELIPVCRACDHGMVPRLPRFPVEEVYARREGEGKPGKREDGRPHRVGSAVRTIRAGPHSGPYLDFGAAGGVGRGGLPNFLACSSALINWKGSMAILSPGLSPSLISTSDSLASPSRTTRESNPPSGFLTAT